VKKSLVLMVVILLLGGGVLFGSQAQRVGAKESPQILEFNTMIGVPRPYVGTTNPVRGISGGGLPWVIGSASGELSANGKLEVKVRGLVFDPNDPEVIARGLAGMNTIPQFRAIVSCLSVDADGNPSTVNLMTDPFPATTGLAVDGGGRANIEARLDLPTPCIAPIVFVTSPGGAWFAATGN
jgi:hypothetical protein